MLVTKERLIQKIAEAVQVHEGWFAGSRSHRNQNPGNLKWIGQRGSVGKDAQGFAVFSDYATGFNALKADISYKIFVRKLPNLYEFFSRYAPASDGNNVKRYAEVVLSRLEDYGPDKQGWTIYTPFDDMIGPKFEVLTVDPKIVRVKLVTNRIFWPTLDKKIKELEMWFDEKSEGRLEIAVDVEPVDFVDVPFIPYPPYENLDGVDFGWYDEHITPLGKGYHAVMLLMELSEWKARGARGWRTDAETGAVELQIACREDEREQIADGGRVLVDDAMFLALARHELMHALFMMTGQPDTTHYWYDRTLELDNAIKEIQSAQLDRLVKKAPEEFHYTFNDDLAYGTRGPQIAALQKALKLDGVFPDSTPETGYYGQITAKGVFEFWKKYAIASWLEMYVYASTKGGKRVGPKTRAKLNLLFG